MTASVSRSNDDLADVSGTPRLDPPDQASPPLAARLRQLTPARVGLRTTGISLATSELLDFQLAHARARDAVHAALQPAPLVAALRELLKTSGVRESEVILLHSAAKDRQTYLQRPDLGRMLDETSRQFLKDCPRQEFDLAIVFADGLSALAVERNATLLLAELLPGLSKSMPYLRIAPMCLVEQGRVAIGDEVAHALSARLVVVLIGERPGLSSPDSLGAYITWQPTPGRTTDAERNCISNIRSGGLSYAQASSRLLYYIRQAHEKQMTGVTLKDPDVETPIRQLESTSDTGIQK